MPADVSLQFSWHSEHTCLCHSYCFRKRPSAVLLRKLIPHLNNRFKIQLLLITCIYFVVVMNF